jgi:PII-like signaling protein
METVLTYESVLELIKQQSILFNQNLDRERQERELSNKKFNENLEKSRLEFDKKLGEITGTWGKFVEGLVQPKIVEMFQEKGIEIRTSLQNVKGYLGKKEHYQIDLLLINSTIAVVVEVKSTFGISEVNEHLKRMEKIQKVQPDRIDLKGVTLYGAVAGMLIESEADKYAYRKGLYVLKQKGNLVEIVNDSKFQPKEWKVEY